MENKIAIIRCSCGFRYALSIDMIKYARFDIMKEIEKGHLVHNFKWHFEEIKNEKIQ